MKLKASSTRLRVLKSYWNFFWAGLAKLRQTGSIFPSQRFLIAKMIAPVPKAYRGRILEIGAGSGAVTLELARRCPHAKVIACEINQTLARDTSKMLGDFGFDARVEVFIDSAENLLSQINGGGVGKPDYIISSIPLGTLPIYKKKALLDTIRATLEEGGMYIQFQHSLLDRKIIESLFPCTHMVPVFWNFPPAVVYYAKSGSQTFAVNEADLADCA